MGPVPNVVGCPEGLLKDFRAAFLGALALGVEVPTGLGSTTVNAFGSRVGSLTTSVVVEICTRCNACTFQPSSSHSSL